MATVSDKNAIDAIESSGKMFEDTLKQFRVCHDLLVQSGLFEKGEILEMDKCAAIFRDLGLKTTTLAKVSSNQWLSTVLLYYENLKEFNAKNSKEMQDQLVKQAGELSKAFKITSTWADSLCKNIKKTGEDTVKGAEEIKKRFEAATMRAKGDQEEAKKKAQEATEAFEKAEAAAKKHHNIFHSAKKHEEEHLAAEAKKLKIEADTKLKAAEGELKLAQSNEDKAKNVSCKAADLLTVLTSLASTCDVIATYWTMEGARFLSNSPSGKAIVVSEGNVVFWKGAKSNFEKYVTVMSYITNCFNFTTDAKLPPYQKLRFGSLDFDFEVPANLDVKDIMEN